MKRIINIITFIKYSFIEYQAVILFSLIVLGTLSILSFLPYFNLFLRIDNIIIIFWIITVLLLWPPVRLSFILSIIFSFVAYFFLLFGLDFLAEKAGNVIYIFLVTGFLQMLYPYLKKEKL